MSLSYRHIHQSALRHFLLRSSINLDAWERAAFAETLADSISEMTPPEVSDHETNDDAVALGEALRCDGCAALGPLFSEEEAAEIRAYFQRTPAWPGHSKGMKMTAASCAWDDPPPGQAQSCYDQADILAAPYLMGLLQDKTLQAAAHYYLGATPTLYGVNAFWSLPHRAPPVYNTQTGHRDLEMLKTFSLFVLLTPQPTAQDGAHIYLPGSHHPQAWRERLAAAGERLDPGEISAQFKVRGSDLLTYNALHERFGRIFCGPAGTAFVTDPYGLHLGLPPLTAPRLVLWMRWGLHELWDGIGGTPHLPHLRAQIPDTPRQNFIHRLYLDLA